MTGLVLLLVQIAAAIPALPPSDWATLPLLRLRQPSPPSSEAIMFVRDEVAAGRCGAAMRGGGGWTVRVDVAVLASADGQPRRVVPRAIGCPTVEQFASGMISRLARGNVVADGEAWYRATITFAWPE